MTAPKCDYPLRTWLAENVRTFRTKLDLSQEELALKAGFHRTYVSQIERGVVNLTIDNLGKLAAVLKIAPAKLIAAPRARKPPVSSD